MIVKKRSLQCLVLALLLLVIAGCAAHDSLQNAAVTEAAVGESIRNVRSQTSWQLLPGRFIRWHRSFFRASEGNRTPGTSLGSLGITIIRRSHAYQNVVSTITKPAAQVNRNQRKVAHGAGGRSQAKALDAVTQARAYPGRPYALPGTSKYYSPTGFLTVALKSSRREEETTIRLFTSSR